MIFPNNTRKIIFQRDFFGKTIFFGRLEKEIMVSLAVNEARTRIEISKFVKPVLRSQDICLKVSINSF